MFVNTKKSYMFRSFTFDHPQEAICRALCSYYNNYSNGTKHGIWPPEDGRIERTETCRGLVVFTNMFLKF